MNSVCQYSGLCTRERNAAFADIDKLHRRHCRRAGLAAGQQRVKLARRGIRAYAPRLAEQLICHIAARRHDRNNFVPGVGTVGYYGGGAPEPFRSGQRASAEFLNYKHFITQIKKK